MQREASSRIVRRFPVPFYISNLLPWIILVISLILTFFVYFVSNHYYEKRAQEIFKEKIDSSLLHLQEHIQRV